MIGTLAVVGNPTKRGHYTMKRRRHHKRKFRMVRRIGRNPSRAGTLNLSGFGPIVSHAIPIGIGAVGGILLPKLVRNATPVIKYLVPAGLGIVVPMILSGIIGRKNAFLVATGAVAVIVIQAVDDLLASGIIGGARATGVPSSTGDAEMHDREMSENVFRDEMRDEMRDDVHDEMRDYINDADDSNYP